MPIKAVPSWQLQIYVETPAQPELYSIVFISFLLFSYLHLQLVHVYYSL